MGPETFEADVEELVAVELVVFDGRQVPHLGLDVVLSCTVHLVGVASIQHYIQKQ